MGALITNHMYNKKHNITLSQQRSCCQQTICRFLLYLSYCVQDVQTIYRRMRQTVTLTNNIIS